MTGPDTLQQQILSIGAIVLDQGRKIDAHSRNMTIAALIGMVAAGVLTAHASIACLTLLAFAVLAGLLELYFAIRVMIDAALFRQLAMTAADSDTAIFDAAMLQLGLLPPEKANRPLQDRMSGARRLMYRQAAALILQVGLIIAGAICAAAR